MILADKTGEPGKKAGLPKASSAAVLISISDLEEQIKPEADRIQNACGEQAVLVEPSAFPQANLSNQAFMLCS